jgi:hypothetical protein
MSQTCACKHVKRISEIKQKQNNLVEIWECEYNELARSDILFKHMILKQTSNHLLILESTYRWKNKCYNTYLRGRS